MKKILILMFTMLLIFSFATVAFAKDVEQDTGEEIRVYVEEKIVPILMGVATSVIALLGTLKSVFSALKGLKESKAAFDKEQASIKENSKKELEEIKQKYDEIKASVENVPLLDTQLRELNKQASVLSLEIANLSKIASIGFSMDSELVKEGKSREIVRLASKNEELITNEGV